VWIEKLKLSYPKFLNLGLKQWLSIVELSVELKPNLVVVFVDLKSNVNSKDNIVDLYVSKLGDNKQDLGRIEIPLIN